MTNSLWKFGNNLVNWSCRHFFSFLFKKGFLRGCYRAVAAHYLLPWPSPGQFYTSSKNSVKIHLVSCIIPPWDGHDAGLLVVLLPPADYCTYRATSSSATQIFKWCSKTLWIFFYSTIILEQIKFKISSDYQVFCLIWLKSKQYITYKTHKTVLGKQANFLQVFKKCLFCLGNFAHKVAKMQTTTLKQQCAQSKKKSCTALLNFFTTMTIMCSRFCKLVKLGKKLLSQKWSLNFLLHYYLQMIILFLKMATFGWNNEWSYFFACSLLVMVGGQSVPKGI